MNIRGFISKIFQKQNLNSNKRTDLLQKINRAGFPDNEVFVSVDDFFDGNESNGSIGMNIYPAPPSLQDFHKTLTAIANDERTETLLIRVADIDDAEWFYSDTICIVGDYSLLQIKEIFKNLRPDEIYEGFMYNKPSNIPPPNPGNKIYSIWWD
jgi:hypothetical protein